MARRANRGSDHAATIARIDGSEAASPRAHLEVSFDEQAVLGALFGEFDANLVQIENRLGVFIAARGDKVVIEGGEEEVARARDVLLKMHEKLLTGEEMDAGAIEALIAMSNEPTLEGIITGDARTPPIMIRTRKKTITPRSARQGEYMHLLAKEDVIFALGPAGTGKTYLAVAQAVSQLITGSVQRLILSRPAVEAGERLGFLPGDLMAKIDPYLRPLYDALYDMLDIDGVQRLIEKQIVEVAPLAFMRGRTLNNSFIILDEAQNTTPEQMKMFLTRIGFNSRVVVTGDITQVDVPNGKSGLASLEQTLAGIDNLAFVRLGGADVVRHKIVADIVAAYERRDAARDRPDT